MLKNTINLNKVRKKIKKLLWLLGDKAFLVFISLFVIALLANLLIFYIYTTKVPKKEPNINFQSVTLNEKLYQSFLKNYKERQENFNQIGNKVYADPFFDPLSPEEEDNNLRK